jgi:hypothetical protein
MARRPDKPRIVVNELELDVQPMTFLIHCHGARQHEPVLPGVDISVSEMEVEVIVE